MKATVARHCRPLEVYVMQTFGCFDNCTSIDEVVHLFQQEVTTPASMTAKSRQYLRRLSPAEVRTVLFYL